MKVNDPDHWVAGADGYRDGWILVLWQPDTGIVRHRTVDHAQDLLALEEQPAVLGIDMVIGLPDTAERGGRQCDREARRLLGHPRGASVFSPPAYSVLRANSYDEAQEINRASGPDAPGLSRQTYHLLPKMRALADAVTPDRQEHVREVHPELSFYAMNGGAAVDASKHSRIGRAARVELFRANGMPSVEKAVRRTPVGPLGADDVLDAYAACWTARRIGRGEAERCPPRDERAPRNQRGLRMEIWR